MQGQRDLREAAADEMLYEWNNGWRFCAGPHWWGDRKEGAIVTDLWPPMMYPQQCTTINVL